MAQCSILRPATLIGQLLAVSVTTVLGTALILLGAPATVAHGTPLAPVAGFGSNPGNLRMWEYLPADLPAKAPLVVVLHGCGSSSAGYDDGSGWTRMASAWKVALVFPEQQVTNNPSGCFNWFRAEDVGRGTGEVLSIKQMVDWMIVYRSVDPSRVFVTGISAGGAMTSAVIAAYPEVFAGGAPVAGLPYKCATEAFQAPSCGQPGRNLTPRQWGDLVRAETGWAGPWPRVSIWQGSGDLLVNPVNLTELVEQWTDVHGIDRVPDVAEDTRGYPHRVYRDTAGAPLVESYSITGMGHAQPIDPGPGHDQCGVVGLLFPDVDICASYYIGVFWGIESQS
jgi:poly(hydroxyalkanoate) depolymerase family esterase